MYSYINRFKSASGRNYEHSLPQMIPLFGHRGAEAVGVGSRDYGSPALGHVGGLKALGTSSVGE